MKTRAAYDALIHLLEVVHIPDLRWLCYAFSVLESFDTIVRYCIMSIISKPAENQVAAYQCPCPSFPCIAMDNSYVFGLF